MLTIRGPLSLSELERRVIELLLQGDDEERPLLRKQFETIWLTERVPKESGYWAKFAVHEALPTTAEYDDYDLEGVSAVVSGELCDFALSMFDGRIFLLYCETRSKAHWPKPEIIEKVFRQDNAHPIH